MKDDIKQEPDREERLLKVLAIVTDWLKFAETKNAMLIGFNGASIYGLAKALELDFFKSSSLWTGYAFFVIVLLAFSTIICLIAFVPQLTIFFSGNYSGTGELNSIFYEHLKGQTELQIMQSICETGDTDFTKFETDIANQIQQNANIASKKYSYFKIAVWITMSAYITPVLAAIFGIINYSQTKRPE